MAMHTLDRDTRTAQLLDDIEQISAAASHELRDQLREALLYCDELRRIAGTGGAPLVTHIEHCIASTMENVSALRQYAYLVQNSDKRVIFINPYQEDLALIGTTDIPYEGKPEEVAADGSEVDYLIKVVNRYFKRQLTRDDLVYSFSGVRPLYDDNAENPSAVTRDYIFELDAVDGKAPLLSVFGGKITTFRKLSEHALDRLKPFFPAMKPEWTSTAHLPGGDIANADFEQFLGDLRAAFGWLPAPLLKHYARLYGTRALDLLSGARSPADLGRPFGPRLYEREALYLMANEWAVTAEDILERRTKHGLHMSADERADFEDWCSARLAKAG